MKNNNSVVFKGRKEGITIMLDETADYSEIKETLKSKLTDAKTFFGDTRASIRFTGRELSEEEETELISIIRNSTDLNISFVTVPDETRENEQTDARGKVSGMILNASESLTYYQMGSLRSGQCVQHDGSVVVVGDVNPGAEVFASGSIIVLGVARGLIHAGCEGDYGSFVVALKLNPVQLRIAGIYTVTPKDGLNTGRGQKKQLAPSIAFIREGKIVVEPLTAN